MSRAEQELKTKGARASKLAQPVPAEVAVGGLALVPPPAARLDSTVGLRKGGRSLGENAHVLDFWSWAFSDLRQNNVRGHLAEYIVALALGVPLRVRSSWDDYDLLVPPGRLTRGAIRVQVKSAAYLQAWSQRKLSAITFGGLRRRPFPWSADQGFVLGETKCPKADVFVFAIEIARRHEDYDPLEINQWAFRVLPAHRITQDTLSLGALSRLVPEVTFGSLAETVAQAARARGRKLAGAKAQLSKAEQRADRAAVERWKAEISYLEA
jgi:hypothetical protein